MRPVVAAILAASLLALVGCEATTSDPSEPGCETRRVATMVTGRSDTGERWESFVDHSSVVPPWIGNGVVLVEHRCGWSVLDLRTGEVLGAKGAPHGADAVGVAHGFVYLSYQRPTGSYVKAMAVTGRSVDGNVGMTTSYLGDGRSVRAAVLGGLLYEASDLRHLEQSDGVSESSWSISLPILDDPAFAHAGAGGRTLVVTSADGSVYGVDRADGEVRWRSTLPDVLIRYDDTAVAARGDLVRIRATDLERRTHVVDVRVEDGEVLRERTFTPTVEPEPDLETTADGWTVRIGAA